jgi:hypothetical protein
MGREMRLVLALATTPLLVPAIIAITEGVSTVTFGLIAGYGGMVVFGLPAYFLIRSRRARGLTTRSVAALGFTLGSVSWLASRPFSLSSPARVFPERALP